MMLKKMLVVIPLVLCALAGRSESITIGDFSYSYNLSTKEATLTAYNGSSSHVDIPSSFTVAETYKDDDGETHTRHHTITVTGIENSVFANKTFITSVSFHNKIKTIGSFAFQGCTGLTSVRTPTSLTWLGGCVFKDCTGLVEAEIDGTNLDLYNSSCIFENCINLRDAVFGDGVTQFYECGGGNGYQSGTFAYCTNLQSVVIGRGVTSVPFRFLYCCGNANDKLSASFSAPITSVGSSAFSNGNITNLNIQLSSCNVREYAFSGCPAVALGDIDFSQVKSMWEGAFYGCTNICGDLDLPLATSIGSYAFQGCTGLTSVRTSTSLTWLGGCVFKDS